MKLFAVILAVPTCAAASAWMLAIFLCNHALADPLALAAVCGHNAIMQLLPSFLIFLMLFGAVGRRVMRAGRS